MNHEGQYPKNKNFNEDLGLFLPTSIIPDIVNESELNSSKNLYKIFFGNDYFDNSEMNTVVRNYFYFRKKISFHKINYLIRKGGTFRTQDSKLHLH